MKHAGSLLLAAVLSSAIPPDARALSFDLSTVVDENTRIPSGAGTFRCLPGNAFSLSGNQVAFWGSGFEPPFFCKPSGIYLFDGASLAKVADENTAVPGGSQNFTDFAFPVISGNNVAFAALSGARQGIYIVAGGTLTTVADQSTAVPDGTGSFTGFGGIPAGFGGGPVISGKNVAFFGFGSAGGGVYLFNGSGLVKVVDGNTPIPPGGMGNFSGFGTVAISGTAVVLEASGSTFGQQGIYLFDGATLRRVADTTSPIPGGTGNFVLFEEGPVISGKNVAFKGVGSNGQRGIYLFDGTSLNRVADTGTAVPQGTGTFDDFHFPVASDAGVTFVGISGDQREGIYVFEGGVLTKAADRNTTVPGGVGHFSNFSAPDMSARNVAFESEGSSGERGVHVFNGTTLSVVADANTPSPGGTARFTGFSGPPAISDGNVAFSARAGALEGIYLASAKPIGPAKLWVGMRNSDDVGLRVDLMTEVFKNDVLVASGRLDNQSAGSSGFNNAALRTVAMNLVGDAPAFASRDTVGIRVSARRTCAGGGHNTGTVRLWYDGAPTDTGKNRDAGSRFDATVAGMNNDYFLGDSFHLESVGGSSKLFVDVPVDSKVPCPARPFVEVGTWSIVLP